MRFLLDHGLPRSTVESLLALGIESDHVGNLGMASAQDSTILDEARRRKAIVVTMDADFHALLALSSATQPSVIRIRIESLKGVDVALLIKRVAELVFDDLQFGAAVTVNNRRISVKRLPLIKRSDLT